MTARNSTKARRLTFEAHRYTHPITGRVTLDCYICGKPMDPVSDQWEAEHCIARWYTENDDVSNLAPVCAGKGSCHAEKTRKDVREIAKVKRISDRHYGIKRSSKPMPFGRNSPFKKKMNGEIVRR